MFDYVGLAVNVKRGCGATYKVWVEAPDFKSLSKVKQHKLITESFFCALFQDSNLVRRRHESEENEYHNAWTVYVRQQQVTKQKIMMTRRMVWNVKNRVLRGMPDCENVESLKMNGAVGAVNLPSELVVNLLNFSLCVSQLKGTVTACSLKTILLLHRKLHAFYYTYTPFTSNKKKNKKKATPIPASESPSGKKTINVPGSPQDRDVSGILLMPVVGDLKSLIESATVFRKTGGLGHSLSLASRHLCKSLPTGSTAYTEGTRISL
ncbi:hypothetical protein E2C01_008429 [Portunus trituberculatus]|uniref:Uncharacterized protein n=1 Tax=Portunus trituberculatus TaxID=210409 RepID=A0A5B7D1V2_PORTR|nr:hypothetical protein [Portunus trituberculatus]